MAVRQLVPFFTLILGLTAGSAFAQGDIPAEIPPSSFTGKQYVDSRGCVYVRAGISGNTVWVPRVTRTREQICGMQPSLPAETRNVQTPPAVEPTVPAATTQVAPTRPTAAPRVADPQADAPMETVASPQTAPATAPTPEMTPQIKPQPRVARAPKTPQRKVRAPAPKAVAVAPKRVVQAPQMSRNQAACQGVTALSTRHINSAENGPVRCGPQSEPPVTMGADVGPVTGQRVAGVVSVRPPAGYRKAWEDGRLNPNRGPRTAQGDAQSNLVWTQEVPRRGIVPTPGQDVTRQRLSAMNAPAPRKQAKAAKQASHRFVQVGTFGVEQNALRTARHLKATGLPVRLSKYSKGGKGYTIVLAGPFGTQSQLNAGLNTARKSGFRDAFLRK